MKSDEKYIYIDDMGDDGYLELQISADLSNSWHLRR